MIDLKVLRLSRGYTQKQLCEALFLSQSGYSRIESGEVQLSIDNLIALSKLYNLSTDYILGLKEDKNEDKNIKFWKEIVNYKED